jgi:hypothetical protein
MPLRRQSVLQEQMDLVVVAGRQWRRAVKARIASDMRTYARLLGAETMAHCELVDAIDKLEEMSAKLERTSTGTVKNATRKSGARSPSRR